MHLRCKWVSMCSKHNMQQTLEDYYLTNPHQKSLHISNAEGTTLLKDHQNSSCILHYMVRLCKTRMHSENVLFSTVGGDYIFSSLDEMEFLCFPHCRYLHFEVGSGIRLAQCIGKFSGLKVTFKVTMKFPSSIAHCLGQ